MNGCETMEVWLSLRLDGMLEPEEEQELEDHLAICPRCRALARELETMHTAFPQLEDCPAPQGFARGVMDRIDALEQKPKVVPLFRRPQVRALMGLAACAVLCIGLYRGGVFERGMDASLASDAVGTGVDAALYQNEADRSNGEANKETAPQNEPVQPQDVSPELASREAPDTEGTGRSGDASAQDSASAPQTQDGLTAPQAQDGLAEKPTPNSIQPSQFQENASVGVGFIVAGQEVSAVLTLDRLPRGWEDVLGGNPQWLTDEAGRTCCILTAEQLQQLQTLAQQEGTISAALEGQAEEDQPCALVLLETP